MFVFSKVACSLFLIVFATFLNSELKHYECETDGMKQQKFQKVVITITHSLDTLSKSERNFHYVMHFVQLSSEKEFLDKLSIIQIAFSIGKHQDQSGFNIFMG